MTTRTARTRLFALLLLSSPAMAEVFIPMPTNTSLSLGSGVNLIRPADGLPSCFDFKAETIDPGTREFKYSIDAVSSIEEVNRIRRKGASVGGSYGMTSAKLKAWENTTSNEKKSSLYVVIEARIVGPRVTASNIVPKPYRASLLEHGDPASILKQCGTHVAMTEHRGQTLRVVVDMREADQATKQEVEVRFSGKTRMGLFKAKASASYTSSIEKLASDKKLNVVVEGSGTPPQPDAIVGLLKTKAGDLNAVAQALSAIMSGVGASGANVGYGLTLQPIQLLAPAAFDVTSDDVAALEALADHMDMLGAEKAYLLGERNIEGLDDATAKRLDGELAKVNKMIAAIKADTSKCLFSKDGREKSCADLADDWKTKIRKSRDIRVAITQSGDSLLLDTDLPMAAQGTLVAIVNNSEIALDTLTFNKGKQSAVILKRPPGPISSGPAGPVSSAPLSGSYPPGMPTAPGIGTAMPMTVNMGLLSLILPQFSQATMDYLYVGCFGAAFRSSDGPYGNFRIALDQAILPNDSACKLPPSPIGVPGGLIPMSYGPMPFMAGPPPDLMPPQYEPVALGTITQPIQLKLVLTDMLGLETAHLLSADLGKTFKGQLGADNLIK